MLPKGDRDYTHRRACGVPLHNPLVHRYRRSEVVLVDGSKRLWNGGRVPSGSTDAHRGGAGGAPLHRGSLFADRPDLEAAVTPDLPVLGQADHLQLRLLSRTAAAQRGARPTSGRLVTAHGVVDVDGVERDADVLVLSTGFQPTNYLAWTSR